MPKSSFQVKRLNVESELIEREASQISLLIFAAKTKNIELASLVFDPFAQSGQMTKNKTLYLTMDKKRIDQLYEIRDSFINGKFIITHLSLSD